MIDTGAGVVDADYRGIVFVLLYNLSDKDFPSMSPFLLGEQRIEPLQSRKAIASRSLSLNGYILQTSWKSRFVNSRFTLALLGLTNHQELDDTIRGAGGFGSTGGHKAL